MQGAHLSLCFSLSPFTVGYEPAGYTVARDTPVVEGGQPDEIIMVVGRKFQCSKCMNVCRSHSMELLCIAEIMIQ